MLRWEGCESVVGEDKEYTGESTLLEYVYSSNSGVPCSRFTILEATANCNVFVINRSGSGKQVFWPTYFDNIQSRKPSRVE